VEERKNRPGALAWGVSSGAPSLGKKISQEGEIFIYGELNGGNRALRSGEEDSMNKGGDASGEKRTKKACRHCGKKRRLAETSTKGGKISGCEVHRGYKVGEK